MKQFHASAKRGQTAPAMAAGLVAIAALCMRAANLAAQEPAVAGEKPPADVEEPLAEQPVAFDARGFHTKAFSQDVAAVRQLAPAADQATRDLALMETIMRLCSPAFQLRNSYGEVRATLMEFSGGMLSGPEFEAESRRLKEPYVEVVKALLDGGANPNAMRVVGWSLGQYTEVPGAPGMMTRSGVTIGVAVDASQGGVSALEIARQSYHSKLIGLLQTAGAK